MKFHFLRASSVAFACALVWAAVPVFAQQQMVTQQTPFTSVNNSFFERTGLNWTLSHPGGANTGPFFLNFGGFQNAVPQFGNFAPGAGIQGGGTMRGGGWNLNFFGEASQGARSSIVNQTPVVTTMNGIPGFVADQAQSPFVISVGPVVGNAGGPFGDFGASNTIRGRMMRGELRSLAQPETAGTPGNLDFGPPPSIRPIGQNVGPRFDDPGMPIPLRRDQQVARDGEPRELEARPPVKMNRDPLVLRAEPRQAVPATSGGGGRPAGPSSAEQGVASIEEIRRRQAAEREAESVAHRAEAEASFARGKAAQAEGRLGAAKIHYQMALRRAASLKEAGLEGGAGLHAEISARLGAIGAK
jgi:hypothetical protein